MLYPSLIHIYLYRPAPIVLDNQTASSSVVQPVTYDVDDVRIILVVYHFSLDVEPARCWHAKENDPEKGGGLEEPPKGIDNWLTTRSECSNL